jgi:glycosyltransferase involved in cell wall biosynthesis
MLSAESCADRRGRRVSRRVTFVVDSDAWGGAEVYILSLLRRAEENGWVPSLVVAAPVAAGFAGFPGLTTVPLARHQDEAPGLGCAIAATCPDVVLVNLVDPGSNAAAVTAALDLAPTVGVLHLLGDTGAGERRARLASLYARLAAVLTPSPDGRDQLLADLGVAPERIRVVPNGVDVPEVPGPLPRRPVPRIGALGRLTEQKGFDLLIEAVRLLMARGLPVEAVIGGAGRDEAKLRRASAGLPISFAGFVRDVRGFLTDLDVFCMPSRRESMPLALLEAMAEGRPSVVADVGAVAVAVGPDAVVVPPGDAPGLADALAGLLTDPGGRAALGARAHQRAVQRFDARLMAQRTFAVLDEARAEVGVR